MRRNSCQEREERSGNKYSGIYRPSHDISRQNDLAMMLDQEAHPSKRYSFLVKTANEANRRPLTSKNAFGNAPHQDIPPR